MGSLPCAELLEILKSAYKCPSFSGVCSNVCYKPELGYMPRGYTGAFGNLADIELILILAEPGNPPESQNEKYNDSLAPNELIAKVASGVEGAIRNHKDSKFHENIADILIECWPGLELENQLKRTWITESVLCAAYKSTAPISTEIELECAHRYLLRHLQCLNKNKSRFVAVLGGKAKRRIQRLPIQEFGNLTFQYYPAPGKPYGNFKKAKLAWTNLGSEFNQWKNRVNR